MVVVNFLNRNNAADQRVYELLDEKFRLFDGVFGASDEVLGAVESGVDFEKRIAAIYQQCRTPEQIQFEFDALQRELETDIVAGQREAREQLLDNFDQEVVEKVRIASHEVLDRFNEQLWRLTQYLLADLAHFDGDDHSFVLHSNVFGATINRGPYRMAKGVLDANTYRVGHPLAQRVLALGQALEPPPTAVAFDYTGSSKRIAVLEPLVGSAGWLRCTRLTVDALETEDQIVFCGVAEDGTWLDETQCRRLFDLPGRAGQVCALPDGLEDALDEALQLRRQLLLDESSARNGQWFEAEMDKLDRWAEDRRASLRTQLNDIKESITAAKKAARNAPNLPAKLEIQREIRKLETSHDEAWRSYDDASREITRQKDELLDEISRRMEQQLTAQPLFTLHWTLT